MNQLSDLKTQAQTIWSLFPTTPPPKEKTSSLHLKVSSLVHQALSTESPKTELDSLTNQIKELSIESKALISNLANTAEIIKTIEVAIKDKPEKWCRHFLILLLIPVLEKAKEGHPFEIHFLKELVSFEDIERTKVYNHEKILSHLPLSLSTYLKLSKIEKIVKKFIETYSKDLKLSCKIMKNAETNKTSLWTRYEAASKNLSPGQKKFLFQIAFNFSKGWPPSKIETLINLQYPRTQKLLWTKFWELNENDALQLIKTEVQNAIESNSLLLTFLAENGSSLAISQLTTNIFDTLLLKKERREALEKLEDLEKKRV